MPIAIRLASLADIPTIQTLITESARGLSAGYYTTPQIESALAHVFGVDSQLILDGTYFVAEAEEQIVGCGAWSKRKPLFGGDQSKSDALDVCFSLRSGNSSPLKPRQLCADFVL